MTGRDRTVLIVVVSFVLVAAAWFLVLAPVRKDSKSLDGQLSAAQTRVQAAQAGVTAGERDRAAYRQNYATVARLGKAVPADDDVTSLVVQLQSAAHRSHVDFRSLELASAGSAATAAPPVAPVAAAAGAAAGQPTATGATGATGPTGTAPATQAVVATLPPGAAVGTAGFPTMPFDFAFTGSFFKLQGFLGRLDGFTRVAGDRVAVQGRLLSVDGFSLKADLKGFPAMIASVHATAYLLPADEGLTAMSSAAAPVGTPVTSSSTPTVPTASATATGVGAR